MPLYQTLAHFLPETILAAGLLILLLIGAWRGEKAYALVCELSIAVLGLALLAIVLSTAPSSIFDGAFIDDAFLRFVKALTCSPDDEVLLSTDFLRRAALDKFEYPILILIATLGMML